MDEDFKKQAALIQMLYNNQGIPELEGYSPDEMDYLLNQPFGPGSPLQIKRVTPEIYAQIPMLQLVLWLMEHIKEAGELKLTAKGYLPGKTVRGIIDQHFLPWELWELYQHNKVLKEMDFVPVHLAKLLLKMAGLAKIRHLKLSLTKAGVQHLQDPDALLKSLLRTFMMEFNWGYFDGFASEAIGPAGAGFSLALLHKYGNEPRPVTFYTEKYFRAFPTLKETMPLVSHSPHDEHVASCYVLRTYDRFLFLFGLVDITAKDYREEKPRNVSKTPLFDELLALHPPRSSVNG